MSSQESYSFGVDFGTTKSYVEVIGMHSLYNSTGQSRLTVMRASNDGFDRYTLLPEMKYSFGSPAIKKNGAFITQLKRNLAKKVSTEVGYGEEMPAPVAVAAFLRSLVTRALDQHPGEKYVTITIPANIGMDTRAAMLYAAKLAELENVTLLEEPLAAFLAFHEQYLRSNVRYRREDLYGKKVLVVDFGGGTCDIASILIGDEHEPARVLGKNSDSQLGGNDVSLALQEALIEGKFKVRYDQLELETEQSYGQLSQLNIAKETLSNMFWQDIELDNFLQMPDIAQREEMLDRWSPGHIFELRHLDTLQGKRHGSALVHLTGEIFDTAVMRAIEGKLIDLLAPFVNDVPDYEFVVLVGGSCQLPQVARIIHRWLSAFGAKRAHSKIWRTRSSELLNYIAQGAALYNKYKMQQNGSVLPVVPLMDRGLYLITNSQDVDLNEGRFPKALERGALQLLIPAGSFLPYPDHNDHLTPKQKQLSLDKVTFPTGEIRRVLRSAFAPINNSHSKQLIYLLELPDDGSDSKLIERTLNLPPVGDRTMNLNLWVDENGLLEAFASPEDDQGKDYIDQTIFVQYPFDPRNTTDIATHIERFGLRSIRS